MDAVPPGSSVARRSSRWLVPALITVTVVVLGAAILLVATGPDPSRFERGTPERVVQEFVGAILDGERARARALLAPGMRVGDRACDLADAGTGADARVVLVRSVVDGDRAVVTVAISGITGFGLLGPEEATVRDDFVLRRWNGAWQLTAVPWPFATCSFEVEAK